MDVICIVCRKVLGVFGEVELPKEHRDGGDYRLCPTCLSGTVSVTNGAERVKDDADMISLFQKYWPRTDVSELLAAWEQNK